MNLIQPRDWKRVNPHSMKEMEFRLKRLTFDGDHALQNNFAVRKNHSIQDIIDAVADFEAFMEEKVKIEHSIQEFKEKSLKEGVLINLRDVSDNLFFESEHMNEFWRVCFEIHQKQNKKVTLEGKMEDMNELIQRAKEFATKAHEGQKRKTTGVPYITHPILVAKILQEAGMPTEVIVASLNHDTVEDTDVTIKDIEKEFGVEVSELVAYNTEDKTKSWEERKSHTIEQLKTGTLHQKALVVADKYANLQELIKVHKKIGEQVWSSFKRGRSEQHWYFSGVAKSGSENLAPDEIPAFFIEYEKMVESFFNKSE